MNLLITGIHGFVGSNLVRAHAAKHSIYGLDIVAPHKDGVVATYSWNDLDSDSLPPVDAIIHLAGKAHDTKNEAAAQTYFDINTGLTKKNLRLFSYFSGPCFYLFLVCQGRSRYSWQYSSNRRGSAFAQRTLR